MLRKIVFGFLISNFLLFSCNSMNPLQTNLVKLKGSLGRLKAKLGTLDTKLGELKARLENGFGKTAAVDLKDIEQVDIEIRNNSIIKRLDSTQLNKTIQSIKVFKAEELSFLRIVALESLKRVEIENCEKLNDIQLPKKLDFLRLENLGTVKQLTISDGWKKVSIKNLTVGSLTLPSNLSQEQFDSILDGINDSELTEISIPDENKNIKDFSKINKFKVLKKLTLSCPNINDEEIKKWKSFNLTSLNLSKCNQLEKIDELPLGKNVGENVDELLLSDAKISDKSLASFISKDISIKKMYLDSCNSLNNIILSNKDFYRDVEVSLSSCANLTSASFSKFGRVNIEKCPQLNTLIFDEVECFNSPLNIMKEKFSCEWTFESLVGLKSLTIKKFRSAIEAFNFINLRDLQTLTLEQLNIDDTNKKLVIKFDQMSISDAMLKEALKIFTQQKSLPTLICSQCSGLESVSINNVRNLDISKCNKLTNITFEGDSRWAVLQQYACKVSECEKLKNLTLNAVRTFNLNAEKWDFKQLKSLESATINNFSDKIKEMDFSGLNNLSSLVLQPEDKININLLVNVSKTALNDDALSKLLGNFDETKKLFQLDCSECDNLKKIDIQDKVIYFTAQNCKNLTSLSFKNGSVGIGGCTNLNELKLENVSGFNAGYDIWNFTEFKKLQSGEIIDFNENIKKMDFSGLDNLGSLKLNPKGKANRQLQINISGTRLTVEEFKKIGDWLEQVNIMS